MCQSDNTTLPIKCNLIKELPESCSLTFIYFLEIIILVQLVILCSINIYLIVLFIDKCLSICLMSCSVRVLLLRLSFNVLSSILLPRLLFLSFSLSSSFSLEYSLSLEHMDTALSVCGSWKFDVLLLLWLTNTSLSWLICHWKIDVKAKYQPIIHLIYL